VGRWEAIQVPAASRSIQGRAVRWLTAWEELDWPRALLQKPERWEQTRDVLRVFGAADLCWVAGSEADAIALAVIDFGPERSSMAAARLELSRRAAEAAGSTVDQAWHLTCQDDGQWTRLVRTEARRLDDGELADCLAPAGPDFYVPA
jgi:hypothetical protein